MLSGSRAIFVKDKDSNFKLGMATYLGKLYKTFEFEALWDYALVDSDELLRNRPM